MLSTQESMPMQSVLSSTVRRAVITAMHFCHLLNNSFKQELQMYYFTEMLAVYLKGNLYNPHIHN